MINYLSIFIVPFTLSLIFTPLVRRFAIKNGLISYPRPDRWHKKPTALLGGISIYLATIISFLLLNNNLTKNTWGLFLGSTFLFIVGLLDDRFHFTPYSKLFMQIIAGCIVIFSGIILSLPLNSLFAIPLTLLWIVGITNSFNLLDNIDGLAAGISLISSLMLFFSSILISNNPLGIYGLILAGAALGFIPYNFNPAKIFMGDSGSMFLGYSLAVISISGTPRHLSNLLITMLLPVFILSVPIFDTIFVMIVRKIQGRNIFIGGRDHTSHHLVTLGLSPRKTVLLLYGISIIFGLIGLSYSRINIFIISIIAFLAMIILLFLGLFLFEFTKVDFHYDNDKIKFYQKQKYLKEENKLILNSIFLYKRRIGEVLLDFSLICVAYFSAFLLRFEGTSLFKSNLYLIEESLVWIILIKMSVFFIFGLYRGVWRYIGISDFFTIFKVVSFASIFSILFLTFAYRFRDYSRSVFFMDWLILLFLIMGSRFLFRIISEFFSRIHIHGQGKKILIFGAGDTGEMVIREIKRNKSLHYSPVGFVDDDPYKIGNKIHGIPILASRQKIKTLVKDYNIEEVIIAVASLDTDTFLDIVNICKDCGISYRRVSGILDKEEIINFEKK